MLISIAQVFRLTYLDFDFFAAITTLSFLILLFSLEQLLRFQNLARASVATTAIPDFLIAISLNYYIDDEKSIPEALVIMFYFTAMFS